MGEGLLRTVVSGQYDGSLLLSKDTSTTKQTGRNNVDCMGIHTTEYVIKKNYLFLCIDSSTKGLY
jgi:hypothetical protein